MSAVVTAKAWPLFLSTRIRRERARGWRQQLGRGLLVLAALAVFSQIVLLPLLAVFAEACALGWQGVREALGNDEAISAMLLSLQVVLWTVPINAAFGLAAAWALAKFEFRGKTLLVALLDVPLAVSPVVAGLLVVLLFGRHGWFGPLLQTLGLQVIFAVPGIVVASLFVTGPYITRQLLPFMESLGPAQEEAALLLGANGIKTLLLVTLPNVRWALLHGLSLCTARVLGEFGAVSVVSGHIRGATMTLPLQVEVLYNDYQSVAAFVLAALMATLALVSLLLKNLAAEQLGGASQQVRPREDALWY